MFAGARAGEGPWLDRLDLAAESLDLPQVRGVLETVHTWLSSADTRALALTGPPGIGKTALLAHLREQLSTADGIAVCTASAGDQESSHDLFERLHRAIGAMSHTAGPARLVILLDDITSLDAGRRRAVLELPHHHPQVHVVVTASRKGELAGVLTLPIRPLSGPVDGIVADADPANSSEVVRFFLRCLRRRDPTFTLAPEDIGSVTRICAASFGIPSDVDVLAGLAARYGLTAVHDAVSEDNPRNRLAELLGDTDSGRHGLTGDEMVVLTSILALPGGASTSVLRQSLPRCDIDGLTGSLVARGLVFRTEPGQGESRGRYHLRVTGFPAANWCAGQPEVSIAAIRQSQADYLSSHIGRMAAGCFSESQRAVFAEFQYERRNLRCAITELVGNGRYAQAVALMCDALPLLARTCGVAELLPHLLPVIREYGPATERERYSLAKLAVRVFSAAGEQEAAAVCFDDLSGFPAPAEPEIALLGSLVCGSHEAETLAECVRIDRERGDPARLSESVTEYVACLMRMRLFKRADAECHVALFEAMRSGDEYAAGSLLLWRAVAACATGSGDARLYIERALAKLLPLGPTATMSAVGTVIDGRHLRDLHQGGIDLAMVAGSLSRTCASWADGTSACWPVLAEADGQLAKRIGALSLRRWSAAGASVDLVDLLCEILQRRWGDNLVGTAGSHPGLPSPEMADPGLLRERSKLTARESEVASLVATGLTNKQIARRLRISEWTAINHLRQVMRKLDCNSRVQVARWVHGLESAATPAETPQPLRHPSRGAGPDSGVLQSGEHGSGQRRRVGIEAADGDGVQPVGVDDTAEVVRHPVRIERAEPVEMVADERLVDPAGDEFRVLLGDGQGGLVGLGRGVDHAVADPREQIGVHGALADLV
ncbi:LuxR C-terminal-related transcriptional regulator [Streptosporangium amethystogenes]|uniref:LuxR C-terminal-related transcriptional regulator n=1 Tax=Streptosporangium amethystogenes TaxID=2002 RepID=UPI00378D1B7C